MTSFSKRFLLVASIGQAVLFSLALAGVVELTATALGMPISTSSTGRIFLLSSLLTAPLAAYYNTAGLIVAGLPVSRL